MSFSTGEQGAERHQAVDKSEVSGMVAGSLGAEAPQVWCQPGEGSGPKSALVLGLREGRCWGLLSEHQDFLVWGIVGPLEGQERAASYSLGPAHMHTH